MKNVTLCVMSVLVVGLTNIANASDKIDPNKYMNVTIEKNISDNEIKAYLKEAKEMGIDIIKSPKFKCFDIGYDKSSSSEVGTFYGTKDKNGNVELGFNGDFKVYSFIKYFKDDDHCVELTYEKGDKRYGDKSIALLRSKK